MNSSKTKHTMLQARISLAEDYIKFRQSVAFRALISDTADYCKAMTPKQKEDTKLFISQYTPINSDIDLIIKECKKSIY
jgi:hypothetical protein